MLVKRDWINVKMLDFLSKTWHLHGSFFIINFLEFEIIYVCVGLLWH